MSKVFCSLIYKAMQKEFFPDFPFSRKTKRFFPYSNLTPYQFDIFVFAVISRNKYENSHETRDSREYMVFSKILGIFKKFDQEMAKIIHFCTPVLPGLAQPFSSFS